MPLMVNGSAISQTGGNNIRINGVSVTEVMVMGNLVWTQNLPAVITKDSGSNARKWTVDIQAHANGYPQGTYYNYTQSVLLYNEIRIALKWKDVTTVTPGYPDSGNQGTAVITKKAKAHGSQTPLAGVWIGNPQIDNYWLAAECPWDQDVHNRLYIWAVGNNTDADITTTLTAAQQAAFNKTELSFDTTGVTVIIP